MPLTEKVVAYHFKMVGPSEKLIEEMQDAPIDDVQYYPGLKILEFPLITQEFLNGDYLAGIVSQLVKEHPSTRYGIVVSLSMGDEFEEIVMPDWLLRFHSQIGGTIEFSVQIPQRLQRNG